MGFVEALRENVLPTTLEPNVALAGFAAAPAPAKPLCSSHELFDSATRQLVTPPLLPPSGRSPAATLLPLPRSQTQTHGKSGRGAGVALCVVHKAGHGLARGQPASAVGGQRGEGGRAAHAAVGGSGAQARAPAIYRCRLGWCTPFSSTRRAPTISAKCLAFVAPLWGAQCTDACTRVAHPTGLVAQRLGAACQRRGPQCVLQRRPPLFFSIMPSKPGPAIIRRATRPPTCCSMKDVGRNAYDVPDPSKPAKTTW